MRLPAREKQWMAPNEEISITARTTIDAVDKPVGMLRGLLMLMGKARTGDCETNYAANHEEYGG